MAKSKKKAFPVLERVYALRSKYGKEAQRPNGTKLFYYQHGEIRYYGIEVSRQIMGDLKALSKESGMKLVDLSEYDPEPETVKLADVRPSLARAKTEKIKVVKDE